MCRIAQRTPQIGPQVSDCQSNAKHHRCQEPDKPRRATLEARCQRGPGEHRDNPEWRHDPEPTRAGKEAYATKDDETRKEYDAPKGTPGFDEPRKSNQSCARERQRKHVVVLNQRCTKRKIGGAHV